MTSTIVMEKSEPPSAKKARLSSKKPLESTKTEEISKFKLEAVAKAGRFEDALREAEESEVVVEIEAGAGEDADDERADNGVEERDVDSDVSSDASTSGSDDEKEEDADGAFHEAFAKIMYRRIAPEAAVGMSVSTSVLAPAGL